MPLRILRGVDNMPRPPGWEVGRFSARVLDWTVPNHVGGPTTSRPTNCRPAGGAAR